MDRSPAPDRRRRVLVLGGAALAGAALSGCCTVRGPEVASLCAADTSPFLAGPEVRAAWSGPERYFDAHAHFFNASDVPVEQFLAKSVAHSVQDDSLRALLVALAPVAAALAQLAPSPHQEMAQLCARRAAAALSARDLADSLDADIEQRRETVADELYREILRRSPVVPAIVDEAFRRARAADPGSMQLKGQPGFSREFVRDSLSAGAAVRSPSTGRIQPYSLRDLRPEDIELAQVRQAFQFVGLMLSPRHHNLRTYIKGFAQGSPKTPLSGCFSAMVDFNYWLDCPAKASNLRDQVLVQEQIALLSGGFMLPVVAYNPWVDIREDDASVRTVEWAVREHGCVGVKIYPPMGFYPYGNAGHPLAGSTEERPDLVALDEKLARFYARCEELDVPVMAHDSHSNGRDAASDALGGVEGWRRAEDGLSNVRTLSIDAGHFGGAVPHDGVDWTSDFVGLMQNARRLAVYADLGFWDELVGSADVQARLGRALTMPVGSGTVADRTLYGSDWHMLSRIPGWESYADGIHRVLDGYDATGATSRRVLGDNVLRCYGLNAQSGRANRARLESYYAKPGRTAPGWLAPPV